MAPSAPPTNGSADHTPDVEMKDSPQPSSTLPDVLSTPAQITPQPPRATMAPPGVPNPHGAQARIYLNKNVTPHLLEGVKILAMERPEQPLKWLSEYLAKKSEEVEGAGSQE